MKESDNLENIISGSKGLAKNPLGIIALFISLIYGFACLVLGITGKTIESNERLILIIFLVSFPILVLISFVFLVTKHYRKLYAPSDFKDEKNYLETIDITTQKSRIQNQAFEIIGQKSNNREPKSLENHNLTLNTYLIVENLVLRIVGKEFDLPIRRNVKLKKSEGTFDCVLENKELFIAIEIKYYNNLEVEYAEVVALHHRRSLHSFQRITKEYFSDRKCKFILYIVYQNNIDPFKRKISRLFENENILNSEIRFFEYRDLLDKFGIDR